MRYLLPFLLLATPALAQQPPPQPPKLLTLTPAEEQGLRDIAAQGVDVSAQDVPSARPVPLGELLASTTGT